MPDLFKTAEAILKQAAISSRPGQLDALWDIADEVEAGARELRAYRAAMRDVRRLLADFGITNPPPRIAAVLKEQQ